MQVFFPFSFFSSSKSPRGMNSLHPRILKVFWVNWFTSRENIMLPPDINSFIVHFFSHSWSQQGCGALVYVSTRFILPLSQIVSSLTALYFLKCENYSYIKLELYVSPCGTSLSHFLALLFLFLSGGGSIVSFLESLTMAPVNKMLPHTCSKFLSIFTGGSQSMLPFYSCWSGILCSSQSLSLHVVARLLAKEQHIPLQNGILASTSWKLFLKSSIFIAYMIGLTTVLHRDMRITNRKTRMRSYSPSGPAVKIFLAVRDKTQ